MVPTCAHPEASHFEALTVNDFWFSWCALCGALGVAVYDPKKEDPDLLWATPARDGDTGAALRLAQFFHDKAGDR